MERTVIGWVFHQGAAGRDQGDADSQRFDEVQRMAIAAAGGQYDVDSRRDRPPQGRARGRRQVIAAVDQRSVDVDG